MKNIVDPDNGPDNLLHCISVIARPCSTIGRLESLIADPGVMSLIQNWPHNFMEIDCEMFSTVILLLPLIQEGLLSVTLGRL